MRTIVGLLLACSVAVVSSSPAAHCETLYVDAGAERTPVRDELTWAAYWDEHPKQEKLTRPVRWVWHRGPEQVWSVTGLPAFRSFCSFGKWSDQTGFTKAVSAVGAFGAAATPFTTGFVKK